MYWRHLPDGEAVVYREGVLSERGTAASLAIGALCGCALVALVDPNDGGAYPTCPTRTLLGIDCPACGTLRGVYALGHGHVGRALDHNLLLLLAVPVGLVAWWGWVRGAIGRPSRPIALPRWALPTLIVVAGAFTVLRNLDVEGLSWLASSA
jgi:hypothetical protein